MTVKSILEGKGRDVLTLPPDAKLSDAIGLLAERRIGALVVSASGGIDGILSERDVVRCLASKGAAALDQPVSAVMTANVQTCDEASTVNEVMEVMTRGRFRHLPVQKNGKLDGIVSIGDVVKRRIEDAEREANEIREYIATA